MTSSEFERELRSRFPEDARGWPFICDGSPFECRIFVVGHNPRHHTPFWPFWKRGSCFDKAEWLKKYQACHGALSPTRKRIEWVIEAAAPARCLETNLFPEPSAYLKQLKPHERNTNVLEFLLGELNPSVVFVHGRIARKRVGTLLGIHTKLIPDSKQMVPHDETPLCVIAGHHLGAWGPLAWDEQKCRRLGRRLHDAANR